jgi:hypothetical protein
MSRLRGPAAAAIVVLSAALGVAACGGEDPTTTAAAAVTEAAPDHPHAENGFGAAAQLRADMRKLWEDHITWTRMFIVSAVAGLPDTDAAAGRLLQNQADIGEAVAAYYGADAGAQLTALLRDHILVAADLVSAAKAGEPAAIEQSRTAWYANGNEIADFLAAANPAWPRNELRRMMRGHLDQTLGEATARLQGDWAADIAEYDRIHSHILDLADLLAAGIVEQFPGQFED